MRNIHKIYITALVISGLFFLSGCEGKFEESSVSQTLAIGVPTQVYVGDKLLPSEETQIDVTHRLSDDSKWITLRSGTASLLRGDYKLNN